MGYCVYAAVLSSSGIVEVVAAGVLIWLALAALVPLYGQSRGYTFFPLFVSGLVPGLGWALVLLAITVAAGPHGRHCPMCHRLVPTLLPVSSPLTRNSAWKQSLVHLFAHAAGSPD
jgi:hypothetical protein